MNSENSSRKPSALLPRPDGDYHYLPRLRRLFGRQELTGVPIHPGQLKRHSAPGLFVPGASQFLLDGRPIRRYTIVGLPYNMEQPPNETRNEFTRRTWNGRLLRYSLHVVQQPEKARACGAGPRSSADRRPVDPPPVVELQVFENDVDITMQYDAGFMLYASLEIARPIAHGRIHSTPTIPVLTGVAVAGAAYLDRPKPAAYFIFPDLSVRHEGWYRLRFCLFESTKHASDADADRPFTNRDSAETTREPVAHEALANRMEVRSVPFQVFSAKKFPGLNTSTQLSKVVADQGCRVRIRRDIRQRKRNAEKPEREVPDEDRSSYRGTPEAQVRPMDHSRSGSRDSIRSQYHSDPYASRLSMDAAYARPAAISRQPSISSITAPSPVNKQLMPSVHQLAPPPPPVMVQPASMYSTSTAPRPVADNIQPATPYMSLPRLSEMSSQQGSDPTHPRYTPFMSTPLVPERRPSNITLPPIGSLAAPMYDSISHRRQQYTLPEPASLKRSYSPHTYNQTSSIKSGARPDIVQPPKPSGLSIAGLIEPDNGRDDDDDEFDEEDTAALSKGISYKRADGSTEYKLSFIMNSPHRR